MEKTFKEIRTFNIYAAVVMARHMGTKLSYAIKKVSERFDVLSDYNTELEDLRIDNCCTDDKGVIEYDLTKGANGEDIRHYRYTKETLKAKKKQERELLKNWNERVFEVDSYFATEIPNDLIEEEISALEGFVLKKGETKVVPLNHVEEPTAAPE